MFPLTLRRRLTQFSDTLLGGGIGSPGLSMRDLSTREVIGLVRSAGANDRLLRRTPFFSRDEMLAWQFTRIGALITHAFERIPFYRSLYQRARFQPGDLKSWDDFAKLPVITRDDVAANYPDSIVDQRIPKDQLIITYTGGSSGKVVHVVTMCGRIACLKWPPAGCLGWHSTICRGTDNSTSPRIHTRSGHSLGCTPRTLCTSLHQYPK